MFTLRRKKDSEGLGPTLFKLCCRKVEELVYYACRNIERIYGNYSEEKCKQKVEEFQKFLLANMPLTVFEDLLEFRGIRGRHQMQDNRIDSALYMHRNVKTLSIRRFVRIPDSNLYTQFLAMQLCKLQNLVVLELQLVCTDKILEAVGENCQKLTYIDILVQVEPTYVRDPKRFNALVPKYCLSDVGLGYLCKCKLLQKVRMNRDFGSGFGGESVTLGGIRRLVKSLPLLQHVTFDDMGMVLADEMEDVRHLSLTCISDYHPQPTHFNIIAQLCPDIRQLCLKFSSTNNEFMEADILHAWMSSDLIVSELQLLEFSFSGDIIRVLGAKGSYLNSLSIENMGPIVSEIIQLIGETCLNLINLLLSEERCTGKIFSWQNPQYSKTHAAKGIFGNLQYLTLTGRTWIPNDILPVCLTSAKKLKVLKIFHSNKEGSLDEAIRQIISTNSLQELRTVYFWTHSKLTIETVRYLLRSCPKLMEMFFLKNSSITEEQVDLLCDEMLKQNFTKFEKKLC